VRPVTPLLYFEEGFSRPPERKRVVNLRALGGERVREFGEFGARFVYRIVEGRALAPSAESMWLASGWA
jgi:hypothetical protein